MTVKQINDSLYRPLQNGSNYNHLFANSSCQAIQLGSGDTRVALQEMQKWSIKYADHSKSISLQFFDEDLKIFINNIQNFLYNHYQYAIDESDQLLRSPNCAWQQRVEGIDCKSYSIIASTILLNAGVKHYMRRIIQSQIPDAYTHVYIVIPTNQSNPKLNINSVFGTDYLVIDGTIKNNIELPFIKSNDLYMEPNLKIVGLAAGLGCGNCNGNCSSCSHSHSHSHYEGYNGGMALSIDDLSGVFGGGWSPNCLGGTYDKKDLERTIQLSSDGFDQLYENFNASLPNVASSPIFVSTLQDKINVILQSSAAFYKKASRMPGHDWSSSCSQRTSEGFRDVAKYFDDVVNDVFIPYLQQYFDFNITTIQVPNSSYAFETRSGAVGMSKTQFAGGDATAKKVNNLVVKQNVTIPFFELTPYIIENIQSGFNLNAFLNTLTNVAVDLVGVGGNNQDNTGGGNTGDTDNGDYVTYNDPPQNSQGSSKAIAIGGAVIVLGFFASKYLKKK
jgi:hypothetical protein